MANYAHTITTPPLAAPRPVGLGALVTVEQRRRSAVVPRPFELLRLDAPDVGRTGIHPNAIVALLAAYASLMLAFWIFFATAETALTLGVITVLGTMYFGLMGGGVLLSDSLPRGGRGRAFGAFLEGRALIATGWISGREAFAQIIVLPVCLTIGAAVIGLIWRVTPG
jgi:hypothetical protein